MIRSDQAVNAELTPKIPIPTNANAMHKFRLCVRSQAWVNSCNATDTIMPAISQCVSMPSP